MQLLRLTLFDFAVVFFASSAVVLGPITSVSLWRTKMTQARASKWFALLILAVCAYLVTEIINFGDFYALSPRFYYSPLRFTFSFGPLFFFYVRTLIDPNYEWRPIDWLHWVLPLSQVILSLGLGFQSVQVKHLFWQQVSIPWYGFFDTFWTAASIIAYGAAAIFLLRTNTQPAKSKFVWQMIAVFMTCGLITFTIDVLLVNTLNIEVYLYPFWDSLPVIIYSVSLLFIMVRGVSFHNMQIKLRRENYGIDVVRLSQLKDQLHELMQANEPFLDANLTQSGLAKQLGIPVKHLSYVINEGFGKSYTEFVNHYRIEKTCSLLRDEAYTDQSILDIALLAGFSSKSTFNRLFRTQTGITPSQYRKQRKPE
ncbi:MAG: helix-turn-helix domain-containing protein [Chloroflexota bacterium]